MDAEFWTAMAALASALSALFAAVVVWQARRQIALAERGTEAAVVLEISRAWNDVYSMYRDLVNRPVDLDAVIKSSVKFDTYAAGDDWKRMRPIFAFYEFLGAAIRTGFIKEPTLFSLVTVDTGLWDKYAPLIHHFRSDRPDLYTGWEHLANRRKLYQPGREHLPLEAESRLGGRFRFGG